MTRSRPNKWGCRSAGGARLTEHRSQDRRTRRGIWCNSGEHGAFDCTSLLKENMIEMETFFGFVALQRRLIESLLSLHPEFTNGQWLLGAPFKVELNVDAQVWDVSRHGVGVMFRRRNPEPNIVVDVHVEISSPHRLDAWRLQQYVESMGGSLTFSDAEVALRNGLAAGVLVGFEGGGYELT